MTREEIDQILAGGGQSFTPQTTMSREQIDSIISGGQIPALKTNGSVSSSEGTQTSAPSVSTVKQPVSRKKEPAFNRAVGMATHTSQALLGLSTADLKSKARLLRRTQEQSAENPEALQQNRSADNAEIPTLWNAVERGGLSPREQLDQEILRHKQEQLAEHPSDDKKQKVTADSLVAYSADALNRLPSLKPQAEKTELPTLDLPMAGKTVNTQKQDNTFNELADQMYESMHEKKAPVSYSAYMEEMLNNVEYNAGGIPANSPETVKEAYIEKWLQPDYKMTKQEIKSAKQYLKDNHMYMAEYGDRLKASQVATGILGLEGKELQDYMEKWDKLEKLHSKINIGSSFYTGIESALPFITTLNDKYERKLNQWDEKAGYSADRFRSDYKGDFEDKQKNAVKQNPIPYYAGNIGTQMAKYKMGTAALGKLGVTDKIAGGLGKVVKNEKLAAHAANVLGDTSLDVAFDTIPALVDDVQEGESAGTVAKNAAKNIGTNLAFNIGGEAVGAAVGAVSKNKRVKDILENPDSFTLETGVRLTGESKTDKKIVSTYLDELDKATAELAKNAPADSITENAIKNTDDAVQKLNMASADGAVSVGKATTIYSPYKGTVPVQEQKVFNKVEIPQESYENALVNIGNAGIDSKLEGRNPKKILTKVYETLFDKNRTSFDVSVKDMTYNGKGYDVTVNKGAVSKIMSDKSITPEKLAVIDHLEDIIADSKYVGSGNYGKIAKKNVTRYDYFETDIKIHGEDYIVAFDVEVIPGENKYRTHKVINEMSLSKMDQVSTSTGNLPAVSSDPLKGSNNIVTDIADNINSKNSPNEMNLSKVDQRYTDTGPVPAVPSDPSKGSNNIIADTTQNINSKNSLNEMNLSKVNQRYTDTGPVPAVPSDPSKGSSNIVSDISQNSNGKIPSPETVNLPRSNKTMAEDIGLNGSGLPWETVGGTKSVAEEMGLPDIRKYGQSTGDTLTVGGEKVSKFRTNTMAKEGNFSPEEAAEVYGEEFYKYIPKSEKETFDIAASRVAEDADGWYEKIISAEDIKDFDNAEGVDTMFQLSTSYRQQARAAKAAGDMELARDLYAKSREMSLRLAKLERNAGQELQALKKYTSTADRTLVKAENMIQDRTEQFVKDNPRLAKEIDGIGQAIYERVHELEQSDLWAQLAKGSEEFGQDNNPLRDQVEEIVRQEIGRNKALAKMMNEDSIGRLTDDLMRGRINHKISEALDTFAANGIYGVSDDVIDQVTDILEEAEKYGINSKDRVLAESQAYALLADQVAKSSFMDKWNAWRYLSMLGNLKTHGRNVVSTSSMYATNSVKNNIAALIEAGVDKTSRAFGGQGIEKTKAILNPATDGGLIKLAKADADNSMYRQLKGNMYTGNIESSIESNKKVFKSKILNTFSEGNSNLLDKEDYFFVKNKYATSLAGYLKANGADDTIFEAEKRLADARDQLAKTQKQLAEARNARGLNPLDDKVGMQVRELNRQADSLKGQIKELERPVDLLERGRQYAKKQADEAAFHQDSAFAKKLTKFSKDLSEGNRVEKAIGMAVEGVIPFKKTPINVLKNSLAYSPANVVRNLSTDLYRLKKGTLSATEYIDSLSKSLTGAGIMAMGAYLYNEGIVNPQEDSETGKFDSLQGKQAYAINIGGKSYTLDWLSPASIPFFTGATVMKAMEEGGMDLDTALNTLMDMSQPILEMSMMDGLNNTLESLRYGSDDSSPIGTLAGTIAGSYVKQGVPTLMGQIARTVDNTRRSTYTDKTGFSGTLDREFIKMQNKIPGLSKNSQPYIDTWGREQQNLSGNPNIGERLAYQMLSPGYLADINVTPVDEEVQRLYDATSDTAVLPSDSTKKINDVRMTKEEYTTYSKTAGQARYDLLSNVMKNDTYKALDEETQVGIVKDLYGLAKKIGSAKTRADYETTDKLYEAYSKDGIQGAVEYELQKNAITGTNLTVSEKTSKIYQESGEQGLQQYAKVQEYAKTNFKDEKGEEKSSFSNVEYVEAVQSVVSDPAQQAELYLQSNPKDEKAGNIYNHLGAEGYTAYTDILQNGTNEKGKVSTIPTLKVLDKTGMSSEDKGYMLGQIKGMNSLAKGAHRAYSRYGYGGIYDYYSIQKSADKDGNGSLKSKDELVPYLDARYQSKEVKRFWHSALLPNTKNPY